jgi:hypothetical protein
MTTFREEMREGLLVCVCERYSRRQVHRLRDAGRSSQVVSDVNAWWPWDGR